MLLRKVIIENVRSFLEPCEVSFDGKLSIVIGPNGGGKTNLLDAIVIMLRKHLFATQYANLTHVGNGVQKWSLAYNENLNQLMFERNSAGADRPQKVSLSLEVTHYDIDNMRAIQKDAPELLRLSKRDYISDPWTGVHSWDLSHITAGDILTFEWSGNSLRPPATAAESAFLKYLNIFEFDNAARAEAGRGALQLPLIYLPVNRAASAFQSSIGLAGYNDLDQKRTADATFSRTGTNIIQLAIGRLARRYRLLQEASNVEARKAFYADANLKDLTNTLNDLGYTWELATIDPTTNSYDVRLTKQGSSFLVGAASSGEREILTYLFAIYALNVRNALIIVDEPELHLHPRWQRTLFDLFERLTETTGNQFIMATHSPTFVSPASIQYVSRVYTQDQKSKVVRLNSTSLPNAKHLFNVVNSQNNERIFFAEKVLLVEGLSDHIFFEKVLSIVWRRAGRTGEPPVEVISVGGKHLFAAYASLLSACKVQFATLADRDYLEQIGTTEIKALFKFDAQEIKKDVVDNIKSTDGDALVNQIETAIATGSWEQARETWEYIKSRRIQLKTDLHEADQSTILDFIRAKRSDSIFILAKGALEDYLPIGFKSKDLNKLIELVSSEHFWNQLPHDPRTEIDEIARAILELPPLAAD